MSNMNGNDDYQDAVGYSAEASLIQQETEPERAILATQANTWATLALAYEQRTANLIAWQSLNVQMASLEMSANEDFKALTRSNMTRLGLDGDTK